MELSRHAPRFVAQDVACKFRPYLEKCVKANPVDVDMANLLTPEPYLSVMDATSHSWHCQVSCVLSKYELHRISNN